MEVLQCFLNQHFIFTALSYGLVRLHSLENVMEGSDGGGVLAVWSVKLEVSINRTM